MTWLLRAPAHPAGKNFVYTLRGKLQGASTSKPSRGLLSSKINTTQFSLKFTYVFLLANYTSAIIIEISRKLCTRRNLSLFKS